jgi:serine/threonine-protein kinase
MVDDDADEARVERLLEQILESGHSPEEACRDCPQLLPEVRAGLRQLRQLEEDVGALFPPSTDRDSSSPGLLLPAPLPVVPGYEVLGVLGRGGMGIVFRARHLRLNRPVALKMILSGEFALPTQRQRFLREAESIAAISHPNIVQVYNAGESEGRPWFTMELVEGGSLAQKIDGAPQPVATSAALVAGIAEGVAVAHRRGIVHRDLKPGNILLTADGTPKVTDFGLARWSDETGTTTLGDSPVGTPSYMAPEQARGQGQLIGLATDVYGLGAILYELLTGRAPFRAESSTATLQQVINEQTVPPARLNPRVPRDLQTICLKCLQKEPSRRYPTAAELAQDLRRFERGEPVVARAPGRAERLVMWARRRPTHAALYATLTAAVLLLLALVGVELHWSGQRRAAVRAAEQDLAEADQRLQESNLPRARRALERARGRIGTDAPAGMQQRFADQERIQNLLQRLDTIRLGRAMNVEGHFRRRESDQEYEQAFDAAGFGPFKLAPKVVAERINRSPARAELIAALDDWALCSAQDGLRRTWLMNTARLADPDPWRDRVRNPWDFWVGAHIKELAQSAPLQGQSLQILVGLGERLMHVDPSSAVPYLLRVQQQNPSDFYANFSLGRALYPDPMAIAYFQAAVALRPDAAAPLAYVGALLKSQGHPQEALPYLQRALQLDPREPSTRTYLAGALSALGRDDDAINQYQVALRLDGTMGWVRNDLGMTLQRTGRPNEAVEQYKQAIQYDPRATWPRYNLAEVLSTLGQQAQAIDQLHELVGINPDDAPAQFRLAQLLVNDGRLEEARVAWQKALDTSPDDHAHWFGYAELCLYLGETDEYRRNRLNLLVNFGDCKDATVCERTAKACLLLPWETYELKLAAALADRAEAAHRKGQDDSHPYDLFAQGLAAYRLGRFDDAIAIMKGKAAKVTRPCPQLITAMALFQKGEHDPAQKILSEALRAFDWNQRLEPGRGEEFWVAHILRREAEALVQPQLRSNSSSRPASTSPAAGAE